MQKKQVVIASDDIDGDQQRFTHMLNRNNDEIQIGGYKTRCNFSLLSNYFLYLVFVTQTGTFSYYAWFYTGEKEPCYASILSTSPMPEGAGRNITDRFDQVLIIGSICGIVELLRNSLNLWAKCFNH
jgi:hypothetical protein